MHRKTSAVAAPGKSQWVIPRAVRAGRIFETSLTSPSAPDGTILHTGDIYKQTRLSLELIGQALQEADMTFADVFKTRIYMLDTSKWADAGRAHAEVFRDIKPALSFIGVANFFDPLIELEVEVVALAADD